MVLICDFIELVLLLAQERQEYVDTGSESSSQVGRTRSYVSQVIIFVKFGYLLYLGTGATQTLKDSTQICTVLHRNDSELVFFIDPNQESFFFVMEDASSIWPVSIESTRFQESVSFLEQEMVFNQLLSLVLR